MGTERCSTTSLIHVRFRTRMKKMLRAKSNTTSASNRYFHPSPCRALKVMNDDSFIFSGPAHGPLFGQNHEDKSLAKPLHVQRIENALR